LKNASREKITGPKAQQIYETEKENHPVGHFD